MESDDTEKDNKRQASKLKPIADLQISQIIAALHQNALEKCKSELSDKYRILNSAIDDTGDKVMLVSSGQHIISVIPTEETIKKREEDADSRKDDEGDEGFVSYKDEAVSILKTYVQWFAGPDIAKKIKDNDVKPLNSLNGKKDEDKDEGKDKDEEADTDEVSESMPFISFSRFLNEEDSSKASEELHIDVGYYISYEFKVDGLKKQNSRINAAFKWLGDKLQGIWHAGRALRSFVTSFFDDVTFKASGIFGTGREFKVKDVKDAFAKTFGGLDPDELANNVRERIDKLFKGTGHTVVEVRENRTLAIDLGTFITPEQKKALNSKGPFKSEYSLYIKVDKDDPKQKKLNRKVIARIVQDSIGNGLKRLSIRRLFTARVKTSDVIYIPNYRDTHSSVKQIRDLYHKVPTPANLQKIIDNAKDATVAISALEDRFDKTIGHNDKRQDCKRADLCYKVWLKFNNVNNTSTNTAFFSGISNGSKQYKKLFQPFIDEYSQQFEDTEDTSLNESANFIFSIASARQCIFEALFESFMNEDGSKKTFKSDEIVSYCVQFLNKHIDEIISSGTKKSGVHVLSKTNIKCLKKAQVKPALIDDFNVDESALNDAFGKEYENALVICINGLLLNENSTDASHLKHDLMKMLFEDDSADDDKVNADKLYNAVKTALKEIGITSVKDRFVKFTQKKIDDIKESLNINLLEDSSDPLDSLNTAYVLPFGKGLDIEYSQPTPAKDKDLSVDDKLSNAQTDLYIVPIPGMNYKDPILKNRKLRK